VEYSHVKLNSLSILNLNSIEKHPESHIELSILIERWLE
ncbi:unnamed protein product, partial [Acidithrix sp. C25]